MINFSPRTWTNMLLVVGVAATLAGCHTDMWRQAKSMPQTKSNFFADGVSDRQNVPGTVAFGHLKTKNELHNGRNDQGKYMTQLPEFLVIDGKKLSTKTDLKEIILRGQERYAVACSHCHSDIGDGQGMIAKRGLTLRRPIPSYHTERLRKMPLGHFYEVITKGYGVMFSQAARVEPADRWAIAAYIRALQVSQNPPSNMATMGGGRRSERSSESGGGSR